jgi:hypothetical protein
MTSMCGGLCLKFAVGGVGEVSPLQARLTQTLKRKKKWTHGYVCALKF